ncbi:MAG: hypothetical protein NVS4B3_10250 [Gemmatimonadaceae bacterium]
MPAPRDSTRQRPPARWESLLARWLRAGLMDDAAAARIRAYERGVADDVHSTRWSRLVAALGVCFLSAGIFLFVSAHWDEISPTARMTLVVGVIVLVHAAGAALVRRARAVSVALHALGTLSLGAAIALAGQIYNVNEHWPTAVLLWTVGAALGWALLDEWPQAVLTAVLLPAWLGAEWQVAMDTRQFTGYHRPLAVGFCLLATAYLTARRGDDDGPVRRALAFIGALALLPATIILASSSSVVVIPPFAAPSGAAYVVGWVVALLLPLAVAVRLRGDGAWWNVGAAVWALGLAAAARAASPARVAGVARLPVYGLCLLGSAGLVVWGIREEREERIDLGIAGVALTVLIFYFSDVMDKLGRSASLVGLGALCLAGGWALERTRRALVAGLAGGNSGDTPISP